MKPITESFGGFFVVVLFNTGAPWSSPRLKLEVNQSMIGILVYCSAQMPTKKNKKKKKVAKSLLLNAVCWLPFKNKIPVLLQPRLRSRAA